MTTFTSPQPIREALATLFNPYTGDGQLLEMVFSNWPKTGEAKGISPFIMIVDDFTEQEFKSADVNPVRFGFVICPFVQTSSPTDATITRATAMNKLGEINALIRQVIRDNVAHGQWNVAGFQGRASVENVNFEGLPYLIQPFTVIARLANGGL